MGIPDDFRPRNQIARRLLIQALVIAVVLTTALTALQVWKNYQDILVTIRKSEAQIELSQIPSISTALWNYSHPELAALTEGLTQIPYITYAEVRDENGLITAAGELKKVNVLHKQYSLVHVAQGRNYEIGTLMIQEDMALILSSVLKQISWILIFQALNATLSIFIFLLLINHQIIRHLTASAQYLYRFRLDNLNEPFRLEKRNRYDEIDTLAAAFNNMRENLEHAYHELRESERKHSTLLANLPGMAFQFRNDPERTILFISAGCTELTGYNPEELTGHLPAGFVRLIQPQDQRRVWKSVQNGLQENGQYEVSYRIIRRDGKTRWVQERGVGVSGPGAAEQRIEGFISDITAQQEALDRTESLNAELEQRVALRTAELSDLYNHAPCGYHALDEKGFFTRINDTELAWLGYEREEIVGARRFADLLSAPSAAVYNNAGAGFAESGLISDLELEMLRKDGSILPVVLNANAIYADRQQVVSSRATITDNSERQRLETIRREAQARLEKSNRELENANKELEAFSYSVSHDLRSPLRAIEGFARIIEEDYAAAFNPESLRLFQRIRANTQKMDQLITDMLALSRVGRSHLSLATVAMDELAAGIADELATEEVRRKYEIRIAPLPAGIGDAVLLRQAWENLIANAIKYSRPKEQPRIEIGGYRERDECVYFVRDNGIGFDPTYSDKLFGVFQRLHPVKEFEGNGVGLAIVQRIIQRHGGRVWAEGKVGEGAAFFFTLRAAEQPVRSQD